MSVKNGHSVFSSFTSSFADSYIVWPMKGKLRPEAKILLRAAMNFVSWFIFPPVFSESKDQLTSLLNCVPCVLKTCQRALRAHVLTCQCASFDATIFSFAAVVAEVV